MSFPCGPGRGRPGYGQRADEFLVVSIWDWTGRAVRMLARDPWLAGYDFRTAVVLGDAARVRVALGHDPELAVRADDRTGWTALHLACASRWHQLDPARTIGLAEVARLLLEAGADPAVTVSSPGRPGGTGGGWSPLLCAVAGAPNPAITGLLLERGARPDDHVLYLAAFDSDGGHECLRLVLPYADGITSATTPTRTGPPPSPSCSTPAPPPAGSPCPRMTPSHPAPRSPSCCAPAESPSRPARPQAGDPAALARANIG
jgi:hypothetical protein